MAGVNTELAREMFAKSGAIVDWSIHLYGEPVRTRDERTAKMLEA